MNVFTPAALRSSEVWDKGGYSDRLFFQIQTSYVMYISLKDNRLVKKAILCQNENLSVLQNIRIVKLHYYIWHLISNFLGKICNCKHSIGIQILEYPWSLQNSGCILCSKVLDI